MKPFTYHEPATIHEACRLFKEHGDKARIIAGGTDLVIKMKRNVISPKHLINIKQLDTLKDIVVTPQGMTIGAAVPLSQVGKHKDVLKFLPMISKAALSVGSAQVRNRATIGGNICNAAPSADMAPGLLALDATLTIAGPDGERKLPIACFFTGPGSIALESGEIVTHLFIPQPEPALNMVYLKHGPRQAMDCSVVGVAMCFKIHPTTNICEDVRIALGAVAPIPKRASSTEKMIAGRAVSDLDLEAVAEMIQTEAAPISDLRASAEYRSEMVSTLTSKAIQILNSVAVES